jgi:hypothetical protein
LFVIIIDRVCFGYNVFIFRGNTTMPKPERDKISKLEDLPNVGKAMSSDLRSIGISHPSQIIGKNPFNGVCPQALLPPSCIRQTRRKKSSCDQPL